MRSSSLAFLNYKKTTLSEKYTWLIDKILSFPTTLPSFVWHIANWYCFINDNFASDTSVLKTTTLSVDGLPALCLNKDNSVCTAFWNHFSGLLDRRGIRLKYQMCQLKRVLYVYNRSWEPDYFVGAYSCVWIRVRELNKYSLYSSFNTDSKLKRCSNK